MVPAIKYPFDTWGIGQAGVIKHLSEDDARQMRFGFFVKTAKHLKAQSVALAHTTQ
jgi:tRNA(Ile)-lysidine synthase TilS/MesJ